MELDYLQTRRLYLAGSIPFPARFPAVGAILVEMGKLIYSKDGTSDNKLLVIVREEAGAENATTRIMLAKHVAAIFLYKGEGSRVDDFEDGDWMLGPFINEIDGPQPGIVFVPEYRPVLTINDLTQLAGAACAPDMHILRGCDRQR